MFNLNMTASVGLKSANKSADVQLIRSLLNAYARKTGLSPIATNKVDHHFIDLIEHFQKKVIKMGNPDGVVSANRGTFRKLVEFLSSTYTKVSITKPNYGILTWDAEGTEGGLYHSRCFHVPSNRSGLTIGRGYDMRDKTSSKVSGHLIQSGIDNKVANVIALAAGKMGNAAKQFVIEKDLLDFEVSAQVQLKLFEIVYKEMESDVKRICNKTITSQTYGKTDWLNLDPKIKNVLIDLRFRGDYHPASRKILQKHVANNDLISFKAEINKKC
ncbi:hypothetical protein A2I96_16830 [Pseudoalteromonas tetraodonis]|uniref:Pesticin C-terminal domain-containing protein n=1 Tax=Pseudoalteromonas tetraodonis TaxID=43659 RepID=A0ABD4EMP3_9GAMM|nr:hypothetical protein [Pseudoalteromonas spiralis]KYL32976.1 hypothetical protein A2I96_16830 [Pseudoalteromonas spiralis]